MATENSDDEGSEKLLKETDEQASHDEDEEDCVKLLLNALERDDDDNETSGEGRRLLANQNEAGNISRLQEYNDKGVESVTASVSELNASRIKLDMQIGSLPFREKESRYTPKTPSPLHERQMRAMKLLKKHRSESGKIICGIVVMLVILGLGGGLLFLGWMMNMEDLYILGGIFSFGGVIFTIVFIVVRCQARIQIEDTDYSVLYKT